MDRQHENNTEVPVEQEPEGTYMDEIEALVESAKNLTPYDSDMEGDFAAEFEADLLEIQNASKISQKPEEKIRSSKAVVEKKDLIKVHTSGVVKKARNCIKFRSVRRPWYGPTNYGYFRPNICILCVKQGVRDSIFHEQRECPFIRICVNSSGEKLCFTCKLAGHIAKFCPKNNPQ